MNFNILIIVIILIIFIKIIIYNKSRNNNLIEQSIRYETCIKLINCKNCVNYREGYSGYCMCDYSLGSASDCPGFEPYNKCLINVLCNYKCIKDKYKIDIEQLHMISCKKLTACSNCTGYSNGYCMYLHIPIRDPDDVPCSKYDPIKVCQNCEGGCKNLKFKYNII